MKLVNIKIAVFCIILMNFLSSAQDSTNVDWLYGSAEVIRPGQWEVGLLQPLVYGLASDLQLSLHPIIFFVMPNGTITKTWGNVKQWKIASRHELNYPTPLLRMVAKEGIGGFVSPEFNIPKILLASNDLLASMIGTSYKLTFKAGITIAVKNDEIDSRTSIDLPLIYNRLSPLYNGSYIKVGSDYQFTLNRKTTFCLDFDYFLLNNSDHYTALEHKALICHVKNQRQISIGYKFIAAEYPFGVEKHLLPIFDIRWQW